MNIFSKKNIIGAVIASSALYAAPAMAGTDTGSMPVTALILENCTVTATPMVFGEVLQSNGADIDTTSTIALVCTPNATYEVGLNDGLNADGEQRRMKHALNDEFLPYDIYSDASRSTAWGDTSGTDTVSGTADTIGLVTLTAYGRIAASAGAVTNGLFSDTVTVTVVF